MKVFGLRSVAMDSISPTLSLSYIEFLFYDRSVRPLVITDIKLELLFVETFADSIGSSPYTDVYPVYTDVLMKH